MFSFCFFYEATEEMEAQPQTHSDFLSLSVAIIHLWSSAVTPISFPFCSDFLLFLLSHTPCPQSSFFHASHDICRSVMTKVDQWSFSSWVFFFFFFWQQSCFHTGHKKGGEGERRIFLSLRHRRGSSIAGCCLVAQLCLFQPHGL